MLPLLDTRGKKSNDNTKCWKAYEATETLLLGVKQFIINLNYRNRAAAAAKSLQSYPTLCDPRDGSPPGSPFLGILQARTLEWVAISFSNA